jgi:DNA polymerase elongation subunit (family B)
MAHNLSPEKVIDTTEIVLGSMKTMKIEIEFNKNHMNEVLIGNVLDVSNGIGVYPQILNFLFAARKRVKHSMEVLLEQAENARCEQEKKALEYQATLLNCKQLAIKVFMNTFYGETGN